MQKNKWGRQQTCVPGHQGKFHARTREQWEVVFNQVKASAPLCGCGCGEKSRPKYCETLDQFIHSKGSKAYYKYIQGHDSRSPSWNHDASPFERQAILGTLLGDSSILYPHQGSGAPRIIFNHGGPQLQWAEHKSRLLSSFGCTVKQKANGGYGKYQVCGSTKCVPSFIDIYNLCVIDGKKTVSDAWLDQIGGIGLAWWICDDGSSCGRGLSLHTEGYSFEENEIICKWFTRNYGPASIHKSSRGHHWVYLSADAQRAILPVIEKHVPECMQYKLESSRACSSTTKKRSRL